MVSWSQFKNQSMIKSQIVAIRWYIFPPASDDSLAALSDLAELPLELLPVDVVVGHDGVERRAVHHQAGRATRVPTINLYYNI